MKTIYLNFTADKDYLYPLAHIIEESKLLDLWGKEVEDRKEAIEDDGFTAYPGKFVQDSFRYNGTDVVGVNLSFPLYKNTWDAPELKNLKLICEMATYVKSKLKISNQDKLHFVLAAHGLNNEKYNDYCLSTGNNISPGKGLLPICVLSEIIKQFSFNAKAIEVTLIACNTDKGNFIKNFVTDGLGKRFFGDIKLNRFEGIVESSNSFIGYEVNLKKNINKEMIPFSYDRISLTDEGIRKFEKTKFNTPFPEMLFINNKEKNNTFSDDLKM